MKTIVTALLLGVTLAMPAQAAGPVVLELFTSQGCSSCPPADALLQKLAQDPQILALSFHVDYWDYLGWRDPFSLPESTQRQQSYSKFLSQNGVYTPELVINGLKGIIGSNNTAIEAAISIARQQQNLVSVAITTNPVKHGLVVSLTSSVSVPPADIWLVTFSPQAVTAIRNGENSGRNLTSINNVKAIQKIGPLTETNKQMAVTTIGADTDHYAVLVQSTTDGQIIGTGSL